MFANGFDRKAALTRMNKLQTEGDANCVKAQAELAAARQAEEEWAAPRRRREAAELAMQHASQAVDLQVGRIEVELRTDAAPYIDRARALVYDRLQTARAGVDRENIGEKEVLIESLTAALLALEDVASIADDVPKAIQNILQTIPQDDWRNFELSRAPKNLETVAEPMMIGE